MLFERKKRGSALAELRCATGGFETVLLSFLHSGVTSHEAGSLQGSAADKRQSRTNAQHNIDRIRQDFEIGIIGKEDAERQIADINKQLEKLGIKPIEVHFKTYIEELQEQLHDAQREFDEATTIEAKVKADAKIDEIQAQIDEATKGKVSIEAEAEPSTFCLSDILHTVLHNNSIPMSY